MTVKFYVFEPDQDRQSFWTQMESEYHSDQTKHSNIKIFPVEVENEAAKALWIETYKNYLNAADNAPNQSSDEKVANEQVMRVSWGKIEQMELCNAERRQRMTQILLH